MKTAVAILVSLGVAATASAEVVFDNFGPGDTYSGNGNLITGTNSSLGGIFGDLDRGDEFVVSGSGAIATIEVAIGLLEGSNEFDLTLYDDAGGAPGTALWNSGSIIGQMGSHLTANPPISIDVGGAVSVSAGSTYWLIANVGDDTDATWHWNIGTTFDNLHARSTDGGPFEILTGQVRGAFRVTLVPSPASLALLGMGGLVATRRRR